MHRVARDREVNVGIADGALEDFGRFADTFEACLLRRFDFIRSMKVYQRYQQSSSYGHDSDDEGHPTT